MFKNKDHSLVMTMPLLTMGVFLALSLISYTPFDTSRFSASVPELPIQNLGGRKGADIASNLFYYFGIMSFFAIIPFFVYGISFYRRGIHFKISWISRWLFTFVCLISALPLFEKYIYWDSVTLPITGDLGRQTFLFMQDHFGKGGHLLIIFCILTICLTTERLENYVLRQLRGMRSYLKNFRIRKKNEGISEKPKNIEIPKKDHHIYEPSLNAPIIDDQDLSTTIGEIEHRDEILLKKNNEEYSLPRPTSFRGSVLAPISEAELDHHRETANSLVDAFKNFNVTGSVTGFKPGPVVTVFEFKPTAGTKLSKMIGLVDDIALSLKVDSIFINPVSGKDLVGIQIPNKKPEIVFFGEIIRSKNFGEMTSPLTFAIGKNLSGEPVCEALDEMPHLLMAGQTGSGKSVAINSLICSLLMKSTPEEVKFILVDPKILELKVYEGIPHLLMPVITEPGRAASALKWATNEMDRRYQLMEKAHVRHISGFNKFWNKQSDFEKESFAQSLDPDLKINHLPYIVIVIDELADLMLTAPKDVESSIQRLAQKARACGIHLVLATQRPSVDVITGVIKANLPSRISFKVFSRGDSRTILDSNGADRLLGKGDLLYLKPGRPRLERIQGAFLTDDEVISFVHSIKDSSNASYDDSAIEWIDQDIADEPSIKGDIEESGLDPKWDEALNIAQTQGHISASFLQRQLKIGYNRAARVVEAMEQQGLVGRSDGSKPRKWLGSQERPHHGI